MPARLKAVVVGAAASLALAAALGCETVPDELPGDRLPGERPTRPEPTGPGGGGVRPEESPPVTPAPEVKAPGTSEPAADVEDLPPPPTSDVEELPLLGSDEDQPTPPPPDDEGEDEDRGDPIFAYLTPKSGSQVTGLVRLDESEAGVVTVVLEVQGASPGLHGVHLHETADCTALDASSAGEHFNPAGAPHGLWGTEPRHLGDLGNIEIGPEGRGALIREVEGATLREGVTTSFAGRALIVHDAPDDGQGDSGHSGGRVGCAELVHGPAGPT